ncbi:Mitochondrial genome maintenance exonuclease 1 [Operophtera brumata]|uniref:Mitochondrial genome maintenance exonuclease 1 n=1 Tax=Operophtera brumata TaxID=104452 RepID=A0A0L7LAH9_OPEBR|nr:Mitochondrial genome maintenance exonuclease 1 [Operophtera brumata]
MFRPISSIGRRLSTENKSKEFVRTKVVRPASILKPAEKLKLYNKENKELFGPLLETNKQRKQRLQKGAKNSSHQNNVATAEPASKYTAVRNAFESLSYLNSPVLSGEVFGKKMWQNTKNCVSFVGVLLNNTAIRTLSTSSVCSATKSSPAQPGYASEDKILQIKQHQNDFAKQYPSVTLILNKTMTEESAKTLEKWKQERIAEMGLEEFNRFYEVGTKFHSTLKNYFTQPRSELRIEKDVEGVWTSVADVLKHISSPKAIESNVVHPLLKDKPTLIEWKKSDKPRKSIALTYDNPVQLAAYFGAVCNDLNYKHLNVRDALLADAYHLSTDKLRSHWAQWLSRLEQYSNKFGGDAEKILKGGKRLKDSSCF